MKWRVRKPGARNRRLHWWHTWFAWYPVRVPTKGSMSGMTKVWLEPVQRKGEVHYGLTTWWWEWEYREATENSSDL